MLPFFPEPSVGCVTASVIPPSACGVPRVTVPEPDVILGWSTTLPLEATMVVSGFGSHSAAGSLEVPLTTSSVAVYGAKFIVDDHAVVEDATILVGFVDESV